MSETVSLAQAAEGTVYEVVSVDEGFSRRTGASAGMSVVILKKALMSVVQFGYSQFEMEAELLGHIQVQPV
jgi:hypothetical protein